MGRSSRSVSTDPLTYEHRAVAVCQSADEWTHLSKFVDLIETHVRRRVVVYPHIYEQPNVSVQ